MPVSPLLYGASLVAGLLGVFLGQHLEKRRDKGRHRRRLQAEAFSDYLETVSAIALQPSEREGRLPELTNAKARIVAYGPSEAVESLAEFEREGAQLGTRPQMEAFVALCQAMRAETGVDEAANEDIETVLLAGRQDQP